MIILGDQSPWAGGLLRYKAISETLAQKRTISYFWQDADAPWVTENSNGADVYIAKGWAPYWSLASRYPWSPNIPTIDPKETLSFCDSLRTPRGLHYLRGPKTAKTIGSDYQLFSSKLRQLLTDELAWATQLATWAGIDRNEWVSRATELNDALKNNEPLVWINHLCGMLGLAPVVSFTGFCRENPPRLLDTLRPRSYWIVNKNTGERHDATEQGFRQPDQNGMYVPKGYALVLEFAARGYTLAFTNLSYIDVVRQIRDQYCPKLRIHALQVTFNWQMSDGVDLISACLEKFHERKMARGKPFTLPSQEICDKIRSYWVTRPTVISWLILGGSLNPRIEPITI